MEYNNASFQKNHEKWCRSIKRYCDNTVSGIETPLTMSFLVTNRCRLKCKHCFNHVNQGIALEQNGKQELTFDQYVKISNSMGTFMKGIFSGGEPFLRKDLYEIISLFQKNNKVFMTSSSTNGQETDLVVSQVEKIIRDNRFQHFSLAYSIDGFEEYHDEIRGKNTFRKSIETWNECKKLLKYYSNFDMHVCTTINTINQKIIPQFIHWCVCNLKPSMISILKTRQSPRDGDYLKEISIEDYIRCKDAIDFEIQRGNMGDRNKPQTYITSSICEYVLNTLLNQERSFECYAGNYGGFIDSEGNVGVCEVLPLLANLKDYDYNFQNLWNSDNVKMGRAFAGKNIQCVQCTHETEGILPSIYFGTNGIQPFWKGRL